MTTPDQPSPLPGSTAALISIAVPIYNTAASCRRRWTVCWRRTSAVGRPAVGQRLTDGSSEIAAEYARRDPRFRVLGNGRNNGIGIALASALQDARGSHVAFWTATTN